MVEVQNEELSTQKWKILGNKEVRKGQLMTIGNDAKSGERIEDTGTKSSSDLGRS